jgi:hypothetical protein
MGFEYLANGAISAWTDYLLSGTEIASIAMLWLAFFPPAAYLSWIAGSQGAGADSPAAG